ncbi:hypothetical protein PILCRDRAFT_15693 [Piloderma croceum F 1598]|uniref:Uncharacterized protein n=1 Tax=Piloderma croceum (strain F 1598) TaxID=765440 RepID=A0A0C3B6H3_PILCF|nr:hypothetical protein PILCRDRAFT_15693 [Piloderma croceum F 1598]
MSQTKLLYSTSPSLDIPSSRQHKDVVEDVVETIKAGLKRLHTGDVQVFHDIGTEEFNKLHGLLSEAKLKFDFNSDLKTLTICMMSPSHNAMVQCLLETIMHARNAQQKLENTKKLLPWQLGMGLESKCKNGMNSKYITDITVHNLFNNPLIIFKFAFAQSMKDALAKITACLTNNPKLLGACIISILELPKFERPKHKGMKHEALFMLSWMEVVKGSPELGPINYRGFCWVESITCSLDVCLRGEDRPCAKDVSIIPQSDSGDLQVSAALTDLWR